jgi:hypothetical protein
MYKVVAIHLAIAISSSAPAVAGELEERQTTQQQVAIDFSAENFARVAAIEHEFRSTTDRTSGGIWHLGLFYIGSDASVARDARSEQAWPAAAAHFQRWLRASPNSPAAHIAYARALMDRAWFYRGTAYANAVPPENWAPLRRYSRLAVDELIADKAAWRMDPKWLRRCWRWRALDWPKQKFRELLHEAMAAEPDFYPTYFAALPYLLPQWDGSFAEIESFADEAVKATAGRKAPRCMLVSAGIFRKPAAASKSSRERWILGRR